MSVIKGNDASIYLRGCTLSRTLVQSLSLTSVRWGNRVIWGKENIVLGCVNSRNLGWAFSTLFVEWRRLRSNAPSLPGHLIDCLPRVPIKNLSRLPVEWDDHLQPSAAPRADRLRNVLLVHAAVQLHRDSPPERTQRTRGARLGPLVHEDRQGTFSCPLIE